MQPENRKLFRYYFRLNTGTYKPYRNSSCEILYIHAKSNHPTDILKQLPISIETRLSKLYSNPRIFNGASEHYQKVLNQSRYDYKLQHKPKCNKNENKCKLIKNLKSQHLVQSASFKERLQKYW